MSRPSIATMWYVPAEVHAIRLWVPAAALMNLLIALGEGLRGGHQAIQLILLGVLGLVLIRVLLPDGTQAWKSFASRLLAGILLLLGAFSLYTSQLSMYDLWSRSWLIVPSALALIWLSKSDVTLWASGRMDNSRAEEGLARNRSKVPRLETVGLHVMLLHATAVVIIPVIWILDVAVSPGNVLGGPIGDAFTFEHFAEVLGGESFWMWTRNSLIVACGTTLAALALAIPTAYAFSRYDFAGRKESMFLFMLIQMFPGIIILVPYFMVMKTLGLLNTSIGLMIVYSVTALPLSVWMLKGFFDTVPRALEEAAVLDGCNQFEVFIRIILPLSLPAVALTALFSFLAAWNEFLLALVFNTSNEMYTLPVGLASMIPATGQQWGDFAAASIIVSIPVVILFVLFQRALIQGLSAGAVKG